MTAVDEYLDDAIDGDDIFPCKGCGEILEEGKAFELAGHRWHLNCFRCNTCGTLLDSDANLLLLGDGSLICNNCTYSCSACGNKIEDLAILTGEQAFCATCFRCRNCKRKIENLRYARTSQGIFCMSCHESLMARRRKKHKAAQQAKAREKDSSMITDKSLPALPPSASAGSDTATETSRPPRIPYSSSSRPERSPDRSASDGPSSRIPNSTALSPVNYRTNRNSAVFSNNADVNSSDGESFFIPVALDPSPIPPTVPRSLSDTLNDASPRVKDKDPFSSSSAKRSDSLTSTPHIAFQSRDSSPSDYESTATTPKDLPVRGASKSSMSGQSIASESGAEDQRLPNNRTEDFKLQDAPRTKKFSSSSRITPQSTVAFENSVTASASSRRDNDRHSIASPPSSTSTPSTAARSSQDTRRQQQPDDASPSLDSGSLTTLSSRSNATEQAGRGGSIPRKELPTSARNVNGKAASSPAMDVLSSPVALPRSAMSEHKLTDTYMQPRAPPLPPTSAAASHHAGKESASKSSAASESTPASPPTGHSPKLPRWSSGGDFSLDEDMARILGTDESSSSILRRVSNAVRHGRNSSAESSNINHSISGRPGHSRSLSETTRATVSPRWPKTPIVEDMSTDNHSHDISSPISMPGASTDDPALLKRKLRSSELRVAELERQFGAEKDLKSLNKKLLEKRRTVSVLDTQTEIMIRQLEVLAGYIERAKATKQPIDAKELEDSAIKDFVQRLDELQKNMAATIEQLHAERDELVDEKNQAVADRDRALLEFAQLSSKNAQLADMNNDLTHQIQERFKSQINSDSVKSPSGLGIYHTNKGPSISSVNLDNASIQTSGNATLIGTDAEESVVETSGPTVVNIRKGQVRKFNWKKGSKTVAQNFGKGINRAVGAFQNDRERAAYQSGLTNDSIGLPYNMTVASVDSPAMFSGHPSGQQINRAPTDLGALGNRTVAGPGGPTVTMATLGNGPNGGMPGGVGGNAGSGGFAFFKKSGVQKSSTAPAVANAEAIVAEAPSILFGSDLVERADFERRQIPSVVTRCIEEVELRGMDVEGIYRKTGGNSQVKAIREGFEKQEDYDISDPDLDITAVTSVLKQYFRRLPDPLLTFEIYDRILQSNSIAENSERCDHLRKTINMLPQKHRDCLEFLMFHLVRVANRERENLMSPKNLAVVFAPTIMRDLSLEKEMTDMHSKNIAVQFIIENSSTIFTED